VITDLFSSIDGNTSIYVWLCPLILATLLLSNNYYLRSNLTVLKASLSTLWGKETYFLSKLYLTSLIIFIMLNNFIGLFPFVYRRTTRLWVNRRIALILWGLILFSGWVFSIKKSVAHLAPAGAPIVLIPFLILIETIRILIRPITLTVRLVANISAGHIILGLISNVLSSAIAILPFTLRVIILVFYNLFEIFVAFIQAYIFTLLVSLYITEHP